MILRDEQDEANNLAIINNTIQVRKEVPRATSMRAQATNGRATSAGARNVERKKQMRQ